jgi:plasmid stability protein
MVDLVVKDVDNATVRALRRRAGIHGRSEDAEHRAILAAWLPTTP